MKKHRLNLPRPVPDRNHALRTAASVFVWAASLVNACNVSANDFLDAVRAGNLDRVKMFVKDDPKLVSRAVDGYPPLHWAAIGLHVDVAQFLITQGADVNQQVSGHSPTPIFSAQTAEMAKLLIEHGAKLNLTSQQSRETPLKAAVSGGHVGVVNVLLAAGETLDFDSAVELGDTKVVAEMLAEKPWLAKPPRKPLYYAAGRGNLELTTLLLQHGADPDLDFGFGNVLGPYTPVTNAVTGGHYEIAELLLRQGASPNVSGGRNHDNLFLFAIAYLEAKFTKLMLDHGADLVTGDRWGHNITPLHVAASLGGAEQAGRVMRRVGQPDSLERGNLQSLEKVQYLVEAGADVNARAADGSTPLLFAAIAGHQQVCDLLLKQGAKLDIGSACLLGKREVVEAIVKATPELLTKNDLPLHTPALHWAARAGDVEIVELLLRHGAQVDARAPELEYQDAGGFSSEDNSNSPSRTALHVAASLGHEKIVRVLLDGGADINLNAGERPYFQSAIAMACYAGQHGTVRLLLDRGAKVSLDENSAFLVSEITERDLLSRLLDAVGNDTFKGERGTNLLTSVVAGGNKMVAELLIARGVQLDILSACRLGRTEDVRRLIEATPALVNVVQTDYPRMTPIELAVQFGHIDIVKLLIANGARLSSASTGGDSLAHRAAEYGHLNVLQLLLKSGFSLDRRDDTGSTLLHAAASGSQPEIASFLISKGVDVNADNFNRASPLHVVGESRWWNSDNEDTEIKLRQTVATAQILLDAGADVRVRDKYENTPLHDAASRGLEGVAELLLAHGAEVNAQDFRNNTPLGKAERSLGGNFSARDLEPLAALLRKNGGVK